MRRRPDRLSYNILLTALGTSGLWEAALAVLRRMESDASYGDDGAPPPDVVTWSSAISACEKCGRWAQSLALLRRMQAAAAASGGGESGGGCGHGEHSVLGWLVRGVVVNATRTAPRR